MCRLGIVFAFAFLYIGPVMSSIWPRGVVHYTINAKDYDIHSQDVIMSTFAKMEKEICLKFINTPANYAQNDSRVLYISNPAKRKTCPPDRYDYTGPVVDMPIGYKCVNEQDIARIVMDVLRASVERNAAPINSFDLIKKFQEQDHNGAKSLLSPSDRNYINDRYHEECDSLSRPSPSLRRNMEVDKMAEIPEATQRYYEKKQWPLGVVMYGIEESLLNSGDYQLLKLAMTTIELSSCVVFQYHDAGSTILTPRNMLWFTTDGDDYPYIGFRAGVQRIKLQSMVHGAPGHAAHTINNLMRALGVHMMSNRYDRNNYLTINWNRVDRGQEMLLEKAPEVAWVRSITYDFDSVTHAPVNYLCSEACALGAQSVQPTQDFLWKRTMSMGRQTKLTDNDIKMLDIIYAKQCIDRYIKN